MLAFPYVSLLCGGGVPPPASSLGANPEAASKLCSPASGNPPCPVASSQLCHGLAGAEAYEWGSLIPLPCSHSTPVGTLCVQNCFHLCP
jgi:hypothetical protein